MELRYFPKHRLTTHRFRVENHPFKNWNIFLYSTSFLLTKIREQATLFRIFGRSIPWTFCQKHRRTGMFPH